MSEESKSFLWRGVRLAQRLGQKQGIEPGTVVAHPDDPISYILEKIEGDQATIFLPADAAKDGKAVRKIVPLKEIFDVNLAKDLAINRKVTSTVKGWQRDVEKARKN